MATRDFVINIVADATKGIRDVEGFGNKLKATLDTGSSSFSGFANVAGGALAALGINDLASQVGDFLNGSLSAYKESEVAQTRLTDAYARFPSIASVSLQSLKDLNTELAQKTRFDDDATASGQAVLAQFGLTGEQLTQLTPLMQDYAAKTGKDLPGAAEDLGKAILGQGRALKAIGLEFTDTGSAAGNFDQLVAGLSTQVGGFAENEAKSGEGQTARLNNAFGEVQETLGSKLLPIVQEFQSFLITNVVPALSATIDFLSQNASWLTPLAIGIGALVVIWGIWTAAQWALNIAMAANPVGLIIAAIVLLIAIIVALVMNWDAVVAWLTDVWNGFVNWFLEVMNGFVVWWNELWAGIGQWITDVWNGFIGWIQEQFNLFLLGLQIIGDSIAAWWNGLWTGIGNWVMSVWNGYISWIVGIWQGFLGMMQGIGAGLVGWWNGLWSGLGDFVGDAFRNVARFVASAINNVIDLVNGAIGGINDLGKAAASVTGGAISWNVGKLPHIPALAGGGVTMGPMLALIGDNPGGREIVEPIASYESKRRAAYDAGRADAAGASGGPTVLEFHGDATALAQLFTIYERKADGQRVLVSKMGKQR